MANHQNKIGKSIFNQLPSFRFMHRHADADLTALLTATVPPADLKKVSVFAAHLDKFHQEVPNQ